MKTIATIAALSLIVGGCANSDQCLKASNPNECRAWTDAGGDVNDYLIGGMMGYMLASHMVGGQRVTYIERNPSYHGPTRHLRSQIISKDRQIARLQTKVANQKAELRRMNAAKANAAKQSSSSYRYKPSAGSYRPSSFRSFRSR